MEIGLYFWKVFMLLFGNQSWVQNWNIPWLCTGKKRMHCSLRIYARNVDHMKGNFSWDMFLWKNSGGRHSFMSFSKIFQFCTHAGITKCESCEKQKFREKCFMKKLRRPAHFHQFFKNILFCSHARITKCGSREKQLFVRHVFLRKFKQTTHFHEFFRNVSTLYPC